LNIFEAEDVPRRWQAIFPQCTIDRPDRILAGARLEGGALRHQSS